MAIPIPVPVAVASKTEAEPAPQHTVRSVVKILLIFKVPADIELDEKLIAEKQLLAKKLEERDAMRKSRSIPYDILAACK